MSKDVVAFCMQISSEKDYVKKSNKYKSEHGGVQKETGVVSFLKEVLGKKDTSYIKKIQACIKNRQGGIK